MKIKNIVALGLVLTCSFSAFAQKEEKLEKQLAKVDETLVGTWDQECDNVESLFKFDADKNVTFKTAEKNMKGTWKVNDNDKLVLEFKKETQKWKFTQLNKKKFTVTKDGQTCVAKKRA